MLIEEKRFPGSWKAEVLGGSVGDNWKRYVKFEESDKAEIIRVLLRAIDNEDMWCPFIGTVQTMLRNHCDFPFVGDYFKLSMQVGLENNLCTVIGLPVRSKERGQMSRKELRIELEKIA
jgi:hypothetical protein